MGRQTATAQEQTVAVDWAFSGIGAFGSDLADLVGGSIYLFEVDPAEATPLDDIAFASYLAGLRAMGWNSDPAPVRLGYVATLALKWGATTPGYLAGHLDANRQQITVQQFGRPLEHIIDGWVALTDFALERADETRRMLGVC